MGYIDELDAFAEAFAAVANEEPQAEQPPTVRQRLDAKTRHLDFTMEIVTARRRKQLTQTELAKLVEMSPSAIQEAESRKGNPRLKTLLLIAEALGVQLKLV
jgi:DNA-binding XRE family transcriptional regulator